MDTPSTPARERQEDYNPRIMFCYKARSGWLLWIEGHKHGSRFLHKFGLHSNHMITILILVAFILSIMAAAVCSYTSRVQGFLHQGSLCLSVNSYCSWNEVVIHCSFDSVSLLSQPHPTKALFGQMFLEEEECSPWLISRETHIKATKEGHCTGVLRAVTVGEQEIIEHAEKVKPLCGVCREAKWSNSAKTEISQADPPMILQSHFWWQHTYVKEWFPVHRIITFPTARQESNGEQIKKMWHLYGMEFLWSPKRKKAWSHATAGAWRTHNVSQALTNSLNDSNNVEYRFSCFSCCLIKTPRQKPLKGERVYLSSQPETMQENKADFKKDPNMKL